MLQKLCGSLAHGGFRGTFPFLHVYIYFCYLQMEYILRAKRSELTSKLMLSGSDGLSNDLRKMDPETQARLETLLEAAGVLSINKLITAFSVLVFNVLV